MAGSRGAAKKHASKGGKGSLSRGHLGAVIVALIVLALAFSACSGGEDETSGDLAVTPASSEQTAVEGSESGQPQTSTADTSNVKKRGSSQEKEQVESTAALSEDDETSAAEADDNEELDGGEQKDAESTDDKSTTDITESEPEELAEPDDLSAAAAVDEEAEDSAGLEPEPGVEGTLLVYFLDVGQGDSEFLVLPDGKTVLIDAGDEQAGDAIAARIQSLGYGQIDYLVATNAEPDHIGGMQTVLWSDVYIGQVVVPAVANNTEAFDQLLNAAQVVNKQVVTAVSGLVLDEGEGLKVEVLSPGADVGYEDAADESVVIKVTWGRTVFLFASDASRQTIGDLDVGDVDVLKVAGHGAGEGTDGWGFDDMGASVAVIEVGANNEQGYPATETVDALEASGAQVWRTDVNGTVVVESDGAAVTVWSLRDEEERLAAEAAEQAAQAEAAAQAEVERQAAEQVAAQAEAERQAAEAAAAQAVEQPAEPAASTMTYVLNTESKKFHKPSCKSLPTKNRWDYEGTRDEVIAMGYQPCKKCNP
jgi:beta-lactamase superfamily II metal-dependent hydrolase